MVQKGVDGVEKHCQKTEKFCGMVDAAMLTDIDAFLAGEKWSSQDIRALLAMHTENVRLMENMEMEARVNMMLVSCKQYQRNCLLYPEALLTSIHRTLPAVAQRKNLELMEVCFNSISVVVQQHLAWSEHSRIPSKFTGVNVVLWF